VKHAPTGLSAIVNFALIPVFTILFGLAYGEEVLTRRRAYGMALGALGLVLLFWARVGEDGRASGRPSRSGPWWRRPCPIAGARS
jgi:drug/metabolite transporter (DMT)-like permease